MLLHASTFSDLQQSAEYAFSQSEYARAALLYEQLAEQEPDQVHWIWRLGLAHVLSGSEAEAQRAWRRPLMDLEREPADRLSADLLQILQTQIEQFEGSEAWQQSWLIRQHMRQIDPENILNLLSLMRLGVKLRLLNGEYIASLNIVEQLRSATNLHLDAEPLLQTVTQVVDFGYDDPQVRDFAEAAMRHLQGSTALFQVLVDHALRLIDYDLLNLPRAIYYGKLCLSFDENHLDALALLTAANELSGQLSEAIEYGQRCRDAAQNLNDKVMVNGLLGYRLLKIGGYWEETKALYAEAKASLKQVFEHSDPSQLPIHPLMPGISFHYAYYLDDKPNELRPLQNQVSALYQNSLRRIHKEQLQADSYQQRFSAPVIQAARTQRKLRIGYIAHYVNRHPVGFLSRWLLKHHDRDRYDIYTYHVGRRELTEFTEQWFVQASSVLAEQGNRFAAATFDRGAEIDIAKHICEQDQIDILVDLDSVTFVTTYGVMALRPAPVQITWLGLDASGIPAIDYYLADPYVLPESAQDYYSEKIWRMPRTYLAIDGFEVGVPTLRRDKLDIPQDAVIYLTAQCGYKRHPDIVRLQLRVLKNVANSYLLVKGTADEATVKSLFTQIAEEEGVSVDRLRFLPLDPNEETHRANLAIADVVLDTFPYSGATTTMETLWMGVPVVTKVGQQWASRNSYAMMMNAGISEGIAWSDEEYVEWGARLGKDASLREQIALKLKQSRQTAPLWNAEQFARDVEQAYEQMWDLYLQQSRFG
ncbi:MAG TPA: O-linked N-acetylglucosamine transferase, SPINDLY family protein [Coleofasciculaceae cyanobacterium]|jgi:predicted O-linked N-acetylglucosamine transferase (SPINDLY family)